MKFYSPLPIEKVSSILKEQVQSITWIRRINIFQRPKSRVWGKIKENHIELLCASDPFSKCLVGELKQDNKSTILEAHWQIGFWSNCWGFHKSNEGIIASFLEEWAKFKVVS